MQSLFQAYRVNGGLLKCTSKSPTNDLSFEARVFIMIAKTIECRIYTKI